MHRPCHKKGIHLHPRFISRIVVDPLIFISGISRCFSVFLLTGFLLLFLSFSLPDSCCFLSVSSPNLLLLFCSFPYQISCCFSVRLLMKSPAAFRKAYLLYRQIQPLFRQPQSLHRQFQSLHRQFLFSLPAQTSSLRQFPPKDLPH